MPALMTLKKEWTLALVYVTAVLFFAYGKSWLADLSSTGWFLLMFGWLFCVIVLSAAAIVRHAENLAHLMGEPFGTLVLTIAVIAIEVLMISAVMLTGKGSPVLARDTMFAVVMIVLNGMVGLCLLVGGMRHHEQTYNLQGAISYLAVIIPIAVISLVLPNFTRTTAGPTLSAVQEIFLGVASLVLYGVFLGIQTVRHRDYFVQAEPADAAVHHATHTKTGHAVLLIAYLVPLVLLSKQIAIPIDYAINVFGAPVALSGFLVASLVLLAEVVAAIRAAAANQLQRSVNIALGSVLASVAMTIPAVLAIGAYTGHTIVLGLEPASMVLLALTLAVSVLTFASPRTNVLLGIVHLLLFVTYVLLIFDR
jgi:Ca2+:H+ antiporter